MAPCDHLEWHPPHIRKENSCAPDFSPSTRDPESSDAMNREPQTPHGCSPASGWCLREIVTSAMPRVYRGEPLAPSDRLVVACMAMTAIDTRMLNRELKKGSAELIILSIVEARARHGYDISKLIESRSGGQLKFHVASLYPLLYRLEERGWLQGRWVEKAGQRRRRYYGLTAEGRRVLTRQRDTWKNFVQAMDLITGADHA